MAWLSNPPPPPPTHNGSYMGLEQRYCSVALFDQSLVWFACGPWGGWRRMALPTPLEVRARLARACGIAFVGIQRVRVWRAEAGPCCLVSPPCMCNRYCQRAGVAWNLSAMVLPVVGDRCVPDKQVQAASVRVFVCRNVPLARAPSSGLAAGFVRLAFERSARCAGRLGDPRLGDKPLVSCWRVCVELARAWRSGARAG